MLGTVLAAGGSDVSFPALTLLIVMPALGALLIALIPAARTEAHRLVALLATGMTGAASLWVLLVFKQSDDGFQLRSDDPQTWVEGLGISWDLGIDGISLFLVVLTGFLFPLAVLGVTAFVVPPNIEASSTNIEASSTFVAASSFITYIQLTTSNYIDILLPPSVY